MGSASSKFKKYLQHGDEYAAMQVFQSSPELRKNLDPNLSYGDHHHHNTALHYAAKHGMKHLLRTFLNDLGGNPNKKNGSNESSLHVACLLSQQKSLSAQERRAACVTLLLQWRGVPLPSGDRERVDQLAQDQRGNSALHCAAQSGLQRCVELLVAGGAPLFAENNDKLTPCDLAMQSGHHDIAQFLETKMVFADSNDTVNEAELQGEGGEEGGGEEEEEEVYSGLRTQDLQEAKDQLLVETADMLHIPLFTAEALLRDNEWSREALLEKWMKEPVLCCQLAGVQPPASALQHSALTSASEPVSESTRPQRPAMPIPEDEPEEEIYCEICTGIVPCWDEPVRMSCEHRFCAECWEKYLTVKIQDGDAHHILCPAYGCHILVPVELIEKLVSPEMARRYLQFDIKAFVETNRSIKWCPLPGCGRAVRLPPDQVDSSLPSLGPINTSHAVDCGNGHFFCWECLGEAHAPCGCAQWQEWQRKISEVKPEELRGSCADSEDAANCLWLVTNSKPCPNCHSPIQKNEGCNHMKCSKCKFDFCWVCLESWKKHSSATGGYFRCNRFEIVTRVDEKQGALMSEAAQRNQQLQELTRFVHYYTRFRNHENSQRLEAPLLGAVHHKMELLAASLCKTQAKQEANSSQSAQKGTKFIEEGVRELLKARRVLCGSYVYGFYLEDNGYNKSIFEFMQNELEEVTEKLSEQVARPYLRTPRSVIMQTTALARRKRHEFVRAVDKGLVPPETPPALRKEQMALLRGIHPAKNWTPDGQSAPIPTGLYDWPQYESDEEETDVTQALAVSLVGECTRPGCTRPRARNPRTGSVHEFCSLRCSRASRLGLHDAEIMTMGADVDLMIALEMSRLQMIEDEMKKQQREQKSSSAPSAGPSTHSSLPSSPAVIHQGSSDDPQLKLAIELSLQHSQPSVCSACITALNSAPLTSIASEQTIVSPSSTQPLSTVDLTVDYFLKSLACCDLQSFESSTTDQEWDCSKLSQDSQSSTTICFQSHTTNEMEDGRFEIGDLHENGGRFAVEDDDAEANKMMRRSHSTGDLCTRPTVVPVCSYFDSDHSHHEDKPEELARRNLRQAASAEEDRRGLDLTTTCELQYGGQSSIEDTSDSLNADLEVCGILGTTDDDSSEHREEIIIPPPKLKPKLCETVNNIIHTNTITTITTSNTIIINNNNSNINTTNNSSLRIRICKSPKLDTDSSNEYESETGIPKSPTLFISGVSISRTPEPRSPAIIALGGRQSRSSSLTVPVPPSSLSQSPEPALHSPKSPLLEPGGSPRNSRSSSLAVPVHSGSGTLPPTPTLTTSSPTPTSPTSPASPNLIPSPSDSASANLLLSPGVSKSASEPEREKEMFRFPKSSTDGALSSVLLVQESNLSSDDFHEALFLEKSPKSSKRRKKSKKDRNKENGVESASKSSGNTLSTPVAERRASKEASSVL